MTNDHDLLQQFLDSGNQSAFTELVRRYADLVHGIARRQAPADADDIAQAVFWLLARRAREVQKHPTLAGWLFRVTWNCCSNARRTHQRRETHEREAWQRMNTKQNPQNRDAAIQQLDTALAALPPRYRDAVLLRYLQGRSLEDTAALLHLTPAAAGKRAARGLEKLRARFLRTGHAMALGSLSALLATESAQAAPAALTQSLAAGAPASTKILTLAHLAAKSTAPSLTKIAALIITALTLVTASALTLHHWNSPIIAASPAVTPPPVTILTAVSPQADPDESALPGDLCIAISDLLIDPAGAAALRKATQPLDAKSTFFELRQSPVAAAHRALQELRANGQIIDVDHTVDVDHSVVHLQVLPTQPITTISSSSRTYWGPSAARPFDGEVKIILPKNYLTAEIAGPAVKLTLNFDHADARFETNRQIPQPLHKEISVHYTGSFAPGQMLLLIGDSGPWDGDPLTNVRLIEVYKATQVQFDFLDVLKFPWVFTGPAEPRKTIDRALLWAANGNLRPADLPPTDKAWSRRLTDGTLVELSSIARPDEFPLCRWDPAGNPQLFVPLGYTPNDHSPLTVSVRIRSPFPIEAPLPNRTWDGFESVEVSDADKNLEVYLGTGSWKEQPIREEEDLPLGEHVVSLTRVQRTEDTLFAQLQSNLGPETQVCLGIVTVDHQRIIATSYSDAHRGLWLQTSQTPSETKYTLEFNIDPTRLDHFVLLTRPRQKVTFENFAHKPTVNLPAETRPEDARALDQKIIEAQKLQRQEWWTRIWQEHTTDLAALDAIPRNPANPAGAMRLLVNQAFAGNAPAVRALLTGPDDLTTTLSELLAQYGRALTLSQQKFTPEALHRDRWRHVTSGTLSGNSFIAPLPAEDLLSLNWTITGAHATNGTHQTLVQQNGTWLLDLTRYSQLDEKTRTNTLTLLKKQSQLAQSLANDLTTNKIPTPTEAARRLREITAATQRPEQTLLP